MYEPYSPDAYSLTFNAIMVEMCMWQIIQNKMLVSADASLLATRNAYMWHVLRWHIIIIFIIVDWSEANAPLDIVDVLFESNDSHFCVPILHSLRSSGKLELEPIFCLHFFSSKEIPQ